MKRLFYALLAVLLAAPPAAAQVKRIGIIGLDTSHSPAFSEIINDETGKYPALAGYRVVAAYPYGSKTLKASFDRIPGITEQVKKYGVEIVESIAELLARVDYVLLETNDGNAHLEQAAEVFRAGKPVFIDKPIAASLCDAIAIFELARKYNVPVFSASSLRYTPETQEIGSGKFGEVINAYSYGPEQGEPSHMPFAWYGIHAIEALFTVMGPGIEEVTWTSGKSAEVVVGKWQGGRMGTFMGNTEGSYLFGGTAFTMSGGYPLGSKVPYDLLVGTIVDFFRTGVAPVSEQETLDIFTFMAAAAVSRDRGGVPVKTAEVFNENKAKALEILKNY